MVLDACVLVPIVKSDLLLTLAHRHAFCPLWSDLILDEISRAVVKVNPRMTEERIARRVDGMNAAFEDACVKGWEPLEHCVTGLPDSCDRHVVAAAVRGNAAAIITDNVRHFPDEALERWGIHAIASDDFLLDVLDLNPSVVLSSLIEMVGRRKNPPVTVDDILRALDLANAPRSVREIRSILDEGI
ncbi:PIN domain-containing protein [Nocardia sp. NPDC023988]|uniref:PIN domain-containing protein n=1 Tax=unclassified Nocardia TaxID=2637762 RepID=UPI0033D4CF00